MQQISNMKISHLLAGGLLVLPLLLSSCNKERVESPAAPSPAKEKVSVALDIANAVSTRASGASYSSAEGTVSSVQFFCFDSSISGSPLEASASVSSASAKLDITTGSKRIYALVNAPSVSPANESELLSAVTKFSDNSLSSFVMVSPTGSDAQYNVTSGTSSILLSVKRLVAKILVEKLTAAFESESYRALDFIVSDIYIDDAVSENDYSLSKTSGFTYIDGSEDATNGSAVTGMIHESGLSYNLKNSASSSVEHGFYVYPNPSSVRTKLCVKASLNGSEQLYSFEIPMEIERNKIYKIENVTFTKTAAGELSGGLTLSISVKDWDTTVTVPDFNTGA